jgi:hypothetical protein
VGDALVRVGSKHVGQRGRGLDPGAGQVDRVQRHRLLDLLAAEPELGRDPGRRRLELGRGRLAILEPPAPVLAPPGRGLYQ